MAEQISSEVSSVMNVIDTYVRYKTFSTRFDRSYEYYHPSELGKCLRQQQYKHYVWKGLISLEESKIDSEKQRLFDKGHNMHERWASYWDNIGNVLIGRWKCKNKLCYLFDNHGKILDKSRVEIENMVNSGKSRIYGKDKAMKRPPICACGCKDFEYLETTVFDESLKIKGNADLVLNFDTLSEDQFKGVRVSYNKDFLPSQGKNIVMDMKTIGENQWGRQLVAKGPHKEYFIQLTSYIYILGCEYGIVAYENKNNSKMMWFKVERNDKWWEALKSQVVNMADMSNCSKPKLPPPRYDKKSSGCRYCDFRNFCHQSPIWDSKNLEKVKKDFYGCLLF